MKYFIFLSALLLTFSCQQENLSRISETSISEFKLAAISQELNGLSIKYNVDTAAHTFYAKNLNDIGIDLLGVANELLFDHIHGPGDDDKDDKECHCCEKGTVASFKISPSINESRESSENKCERKGCCVVSKEIADMDSIYSKYKLDYFTFSNFGNQEFGALDIDNSTTIDNGFIYPVVLSSEVPSEGYRIEFKEASRDKVYSVYSLRVEK